MTLIEQMEDLLDQLHDEDGVGPHEFEIADVLELALAELRKHEHKPVPAPVEPAVVEDAWQRLGDDDI